MARFDLADEEWAVISPLLPKQGRGPERKDDRKVLNGIFYILRTAASWRYLPDRYGPRTTVYNRYVRWSERVPGSRAYLRLWPKSVKTLWSLSTVPSSRPAAQRLDQKRGTGRKYWPLSTALRLPLPPRLTRRSHK